MNGWQLSNGQISRQQYHLNRQLDRTSMNGWGVSHWQIAKSKFVRMIPVSHLYLFYQFDWLVDIAVSKFARLIPLSHSYLFYEVDSLGGIEVSKFASMIPQPFIFVLTCWLFRRHSSVESVTSRGKYRHRGIADLTFARLKPLSHSYLFYQFDSLGGISVSQFARMIPLSHKYLFYEVDWLGVLQSRNLPEW